MPPKRKTADPDEERSLLAKVARKTDSKIGEDSTKKSKGESEIIKYDEYMEGGIPDALLEGLGFTESEGLEEAEVVEEEEEEERQEEILPPVLQVEKSFGRHADATTQPGFQEAMSAFVASQIATMTRGGESSNKLSAKHYLEMAMAAVGKANATSSQGSASALLGSLSKAATQSPALDLSSQKSSANVRSSRRISAAREQQTPSSHVPLIPKSSLRPALPNPSPRQASPNVAVRAPTGRPQMSLMSPAAVQQARAGQSRPARAPIVVAPRNVTPRTVTKGNIVYERMPTGEVIASLIKKPEGSANKPQAPAVIDPSPRRTVSNYKPPNQPTTMMSPVNMDDCPINEFNVGDVLERSIKATQSMRMLLTSLRDDLRRVGAGAAMVTDEQLRKRQEVAEKLAKAYAAYKQSIEDVERPRAIAPAVADSARPVMMVKHSSAGRVEPRAQQRSNHGQKGQNEVIDVSDSDDETGNSLNSSSSREIQKGARSNGDGKSRTPKDPLEKKTELYGGNKNAELDIKS